MISKFIFTKVLGWKFNGEFPKELKKYVLIGAPHTSWQDFMVGLFSKKITGTKLNFVGKKALFKPPFGWFFKSLGGAPIDRSKSTNVVEAIVKVFNENDEFRLAISPEGTRQFVDKWKTGFYYIAQGANVPIVMLGFDFENKEVKLSKPFYPTGDIKEDFTHFYQFYKNIKGAKPELFNNQSFL
ncbi:1-acyl-sn-glycerol-3-phosphate acyltransferase [Tenacibaculum pacificus]|uniref:1-acyl-sn-glycerol-3-phosphate acyltransferase n=1 Tax=Tenacibaculum pacificus TaxID=3018314 RepID=UPI0022F3B566|nr:1-acyl-sn-glycerol-3-phosphate acyltransferase [Tenacibaculum pacificus]WBX74646.1 1-acyl-sn-glycerol-3-phosphate acyltransferase [Tenacibaculum pacificus]